MRQSIIHGTACILSVLLLAARAGPTQAQDNDGNGFQDQYEQELVNRFCPSLVLHKQDQGVFPEPVEIVTGALYREFWASPLGKIYNGGEYLPALANTDISWIDNASDPPLQTFFTPQTYNCGDPAGPSYYYHHFDYAGPGDECDDQSGHPNNQPSGWYPRYKIDGPNFENTVYAHPFLHKLTGEFVIHYWFYYPFNDWVADHEGDWEHINVVVSSDDPGAALVRVAYYFHERFKVLDRAQNAYPTSFDYYVTDETHPIVFVGGFAEKQDAGATGSGPGSHGSYPVPGNWQSVVYETGTLPVTVDIAEVVGGDGFWIPWHTIVDGDATDTDGVVLLKDPNYYDYGARPELSWYAANVSWGHPRVASFGSTWAFLEARGNYAPRGPVFQETWEIADYISLPFEQYLGDGPNAVATAWTPPPIVSITSPLTTVTARASLDISGTVHYADQVVVEWGEGTAPSTWFTDAVTMVATEAPFMETQVATWTTGLVPTGTYTVRIRANYGPDIYTHSRVVNVLHQNFVVSTYPAGADFFTIQSAIDYAELGDTVVVRSGNIMVGNIQLKGGIPIVGEIDFFPGATVIGVGDAPTVSATDLLYRVHLENLTIMHQNGEGSSNGGGIWVENSELLVRNCTIKDNRSGMGAGVGTYGNVTLRLEGCVIKNNTATDDGTPPYYSRASAISVNGTDGYFFGGGGPIPAYPIVEIVDCEIVDNTAEGPAGIISTTAIAITCDGMGGLDASHQQPRLENCTISGNGGGDYLAGAIYFSQIHRPELINCRISDNVVNSSTGESGVVRYHASGTYVENCTIVNNRDLSGSRLGGISIDGYPVPGGANREVRESIIAFNDGEPIQGGSWLASLVLIDSDLFGNAGNNGTYGPPDSAWVSAGTNVVSLDPTFCDAANGDYQLSGASPCVSGPYFAETVGALLIGCVPAVTLTLDPDSLQDGQSVLFGCPKGDTYDVRLTVDLDDNIARDLGSEELTLDFSASAFKVFDVDGTVTANASVVGPGFVGEIVHGEFGGHGIDNVGVLMNGALLDRFSLDVRSPDIDGNGNVGLPDMALFGPVFTGGPGAYVPYMDFDADGEVHLVDMALLGAHWGHQANNPQANAPRQIQQTGFEVALNITEVVGGPLDRELHVQVRLDNISTFRVACLSFNNETPGLQFREYVPDPSWEARTMLAPIVRNGSPELFLAAMAAKSFVGPTAVLGTMVFDITTTDAISVTEADFALQIGDVMLTGGAQGVFAGASVTLALEKKILVTNLAQNYPNPFNPQTTITYSLASRGQTSLRIYGVNGSLIRTLVNEVQSPDIYRVRWDGRNNGGDGVASGVYFYKLDTSGFSATRKMVLIR